ncbi:non-hydrolyzing UDP-N-acetylglucosamine 2-epimerase [Fusibacter sp. 3D3]|uniref:non-hydrolyzing UDP-N-acetylglucosamine 2-epimerase n=1 Tax=Fusibacter sp. 3D3 TaxID=1048380 RepID=UPI0008528D89|nr:UDP-N-acetylglucosamine 2-epimerase (non-hydrolyzing) [Fusibacter sp. 3D3]GAU75718.1 UDP-N-acetylglucosamine 2-epimerase [Fusibacter sp. 3D3]
MIKVMTIFGTRPEAIKMAPLVKALEADAQIESIVCVTAQHREMLDQVLELFQITPKHDLNIMAKGQTLSDITSRVLKGIESVLKSETPDLILVHGDTTTTFAGALAAFYAQIPVGHVEAGLRSHNIYSPFPEEMNRSLTSRIAVMHFAATEGNVVNLKNEGVDETLIVKTGNTVIDALKMVIKEDYRFEDDVLNQMDYERYKTILLTAHRRENLGEPMENIFGAIRAIVDRNEGIQVIFPIHLNPAVRAIANKHLKDVERIHMIEPLDYEPFANLQAKVDIILTDSGGIQEEAPALGKPVVVLRTETERPEAVEAGTVIIAGVDKNAIIELTEKLLLDESAYLKMAEAVNPYGDGKACLRIVDAIKAQFSYKL